MNIENLLGIFIDESRENLRLLNDKLLELEKDPENTNILNEIFRAAHTFKGMAKTMGFNGISNLTHNLENLLELLRSGKKKVDEDIINLLFQGLDKLEVLVETIISTGTETESPAVNELVKNLEKLIQENKPDDSTEEDNVTKTIDHITEFTSYENLVMKEAYEKGFESKEISVFLDNECALSGVRFYMVYSLLEKEGEIFKTIPAIEEIESNNYLASGGKKHLVKFYIITPSKNSVIKKKLLNISDVEKVEIINIELKDKGKSAENPQIAAWAQRPSRICSRTIKVDRQKLDTLVDLVGELLINKTKMSQLAKEIDDPELNEIINNNIENTTGEIREIVAKLRMVPIEQVFNKFPRLVRDLAKKLDKDVNFIIKGQEVEIDRTIIDELSDPLTYIIRNALDHGFETREERIKAGKRVKGTLQLIAVDERDNILIKIIDDGKGMNLDKIAQKAIEKGYVQESELKTLTSADIIEFIFKPEFTTTDVATDLSGCGAGMDIVKTKIVELNGTINVNTEKRTGTTITINLPLKL